jgi:hypothetical protein
MVLDDSSDEEESTHGGIKSYPKPRALLEPVFNLEKEEFEKLTGKGIAFRSDEYEDDD